MRAYVVDDDELMCRTIERLLVDCGWEACGYRSANAFLEALDELEFGCLLLDIGMPERNGLEVLGEVLHRRPSWPVVMLSGSTDVDDAITSFRTGAIHFLRKPFFRADLESALAEAARIGEERLREEARRTEAGRVSLSRREKQVLAALAEGQQSKMIAWNMGLSVRTVDMHRSNILAKLSARNASQAVAIARSLELLGD